MAGGPFYPRHLAKKSWLNWYATQFQCAEVNFSFYRTPSLEVVTAWREATPTDFLFTWKASKFITHWKRLNPDTCQNSIDLLVARLKALKRKAGPVLFQLPPQFEADCDRLARFLRMLPRRYRYAFEFRHPSWYEARILDVLRNHDVSLCISDHHHAPAPWTITASYVYIRGHGPGGRYKDNYAEGTLREWADHIRNWRRQGRSVFAFFDNDQKSAAPADARRLMALLGLVRDDHTGDAGISPASRRRREKVTASSRP
jgi:uncharacterized protein YecE (DUF72 family)